MPHSDLIYIKRNIYDLSTMTNLADDSHSVKKKLHERTPQERSTRGIKIVHLKLRFKKVDEVKVRLFSPLKANKWYLTIRISVILNPLFISKSTLKEGSSNYSILCNL